MTTIVLSEPLVVDLNIYRGDSGGFRITVKSTPSADISEATWDADIRLEDVSASPITSFDVVPVEGDLSSVDVILSAEKSRLLTGTCVYDVEMTLDGDVTTLIRGMVNVTLDVSRT